MLSLVLGTISGDCNEYMMQERMAQCPCRSRDVMVLIIGGMWGSFKAVVDLSIYYPRLG